MKNQYFGDINDYLKYGLLRAIIGASGLRMLIAWMLTPDDQRADGNFVSYLENPAKWAHHDPDLFKHLKEMLAQGAPRRVGLLERSSLLPGAKYCSAIVPDSAKDRSTWFQSLLEQSQGRELVFLDPDNGLEVKSRPYGRKNSSKFLFWREVEALWASGKSLLIYQHFTREKRNHFIGRKSEELSHAAPSSLLEAFATPRVVFFLALQPAHQRFHPAIVDAVQHRWSGQIQTVLAR